MVCFLCWSFKGSSCRLDFSQQAGSGILQDSHGILIVDSPLLCILEKEGFVAYSLPGC